MTNIEFVNKLREVEKLKTLYVMGCFGAPMTQANKARWIQKEHYNYNNKPERVVMINNADANTFGFDCVNLIKGVLWGFNGDNTKEYGGSKYCSNGVPDIGADTMITKTENSTDFSKGLDIGEVVWLKGHIGVYVGGGEVIECSPKWRNRVQYTNCYNLGNVSGNSRLWTSHGHLPYIEYIKEGGVMYNKLEEVPEWAKEALEFMTGKGYIKGDSKGNLNLTYDTTRILVIIYRILKGGGV